MSYSVKLLRQMEKYLFLIGGPCKLGGPRLLGLNAKKFVAEHCVSNCPAATKTDFSTYLWKYASHGKKFSIPDNKHPYGTLHNFWDGSSNCRTYIVAELVHA